VPTPQAMEIAPKAASLDDLLVILVRKSAADLRNVRLARNDNAFTLQAALIKLRSI
jgi:hypothetical protein